MFNQLKLAPKFTLLLLLIFLLGSSVAGVALARALQSQAEAQVSAEGVMFLESMLAVRSYTDQQIRPLLEAHETPENFWAEAIPAYSARRVYELLGKAGYEYKEAVINPTNPKDLADEFEVGLVNRFATNPDLQRTSGYRDMPEMGKMFYSALPMVITDASCLECHSTPEAAPPAMLVQYGRERGFNWQLNKVLGTQLVYIPAEEVFQRARRAFTSVMGLFFLLLAIALFVLNFLLNPLVLKPVQNLAKISEKLAADDIQTQEDWHNLEAQKLGHVVTRQDELGQLAKVFERMVHEVVVRQQRLRQQIRDLKIEIDEVRKAREVQEIVESDYFQNLQDRAQKIRERNQASDE
jgi:HAMP domain-containing protein